MSWNEIIRAIAWNTFQEQRRRSYVNNPEKKPESKSEAPGAPESVASVVNIREISDEARKELLEERRDAAKRKIKAKLREIQDAERIVANHRRELEDLYAEIADGN